MRFVSNTLYGRPWRVKQKINQVFFINNLKISKARACFKMIRSKLMRNIPSGRKAKAIKQKQKKNNKKDAQKPVRTSSGAPEHVSYSYGAL